MNKWESVNKDPYGTKSKAKPFSIKAAIKGIFWVFVIYHVVSLVVFNALMRLSS